MSLSAYSSLPAYDLTDRTALLTGAASGIGRATAVLLAQAGAAVHCADRDEKGLAHTAELITQAGGDAWAHPLDVTDRAALSTPLVLSPRRCARAADSTSARR